MCTFYGIRIDNNYCLPVIGTAGMKRRSTALQAKFVADGVVDTLRRCGAGGVQFVCCLLTNQPTDTNDDVNVPLLRSQVNTPVTDPVTSETKLS